MSARFYFEGLEQPVHLWPLLHQQPPQLSIRVSGSRNWRVKCVRQPPWGHPGTSAAATEWLADSNVELSLVQSLAAKRWFPSRSSSSKPKPGIT